MMIGMSARTIGSSPSVSGMDHFPSGKWTPPVGERGEGSRAAEWREIGARAQRGIAISQNVPLTPRGTGPLVSGAQRPSTAVVASRTVNDGSSEPSESGEGAGCGVVSGAGPCGAVSAAPQHTVSARSSSIYAAALSTPKPARTPVDESDDALTVGGGWRDNRVRSRLGLRLLATAAPERAEHAAAVTAVQSKPACASGHFGTTRSGGRPR